MFEILVHDGKTNPLEDDIYYIVGKDGIYMKKNLGIMESLIPVDKIPDLQDVPCSAVIHIPKLPATLFAKVYEFFKAVYDEHKSEAVILLFYNQETQKFKVVVPSQQVSGAACDYNKGMTLKDMNMIGTIHSHANMSAFHSGIDDTDEKVFDGLHITIGNVNDEFPSVSTSVVASGFRQMYANTDYILGIEDFKYEKPPVTNAYGYTYHTYNAGPKIRVKIKVPPSKRTFNKNWLKLVEKKTYSYSSRYVGYGGRYNTGMYSYNQKEIDKMWGGDLHTPCYPYSNRNIAASHKSDKIEDITEEVDKCQNCIHQKVDEYEYDIISYYCKDCLRVVDLDKDEEQICPHCLIGTGLILLDDISEEDKQSEITEKEKKKVDNFDSGKVESTLVVKSANPAEPKDIYIKCKKCANTFMLDEFKPICPFCYEETEVKPPVETAERRNTYSGLLEGLIKRFKSKGVNIE